MASFSFSFSGDDIDAENIEDANGIVANLAEVHLAEEGKPEKLIPPKKHDLDELLQTLPSHLSYDLLPLAPRPNSNSAHLTHLPRRSHFDILTQLKAEDSPSSSPLIHALNTNDLRPTVYEGGLKTWECSLDLAQYLLSSPPFVNGDNEAAQSCHIIELGAGSAIPSLALFLLLLTSNPSLSAATSPSPATPKKVHFTLTDYNASVLSLSTVPNLLLAWWEALGKHSPSPSPDTIAAAAATATDPEPEEGELPLFPALLSRFRTTLLDHGISFSFLSGAWGEEFVSLLNASSTSPSTFSLPQSLDMTSNLNPSPDLDANVLVLAAETVYEPKSLRAFVRTVRALISAGSDTDPEPEKAMGKGKGKGKGNEREKGKKRARALIAAKQMYFGVGGGVREFLDVLGEEVEREREPARPGGEVRTRTVWETGEKESGRGEQGGVGRVILEVEVSRL